MSAFIERQFYDAANAYYQGARILMHHEEPSDTSATACDLAYPAVHCVALSLKLYLKCLLAFEGKDRDNVIDQLADLYQGLDDETQSLILERFDEYSNTAMSSSGLIAHLRILDAAFANWRHTLEEETNVNLDELEEMILATKAAIINFKPEWQ